MRLGFLHSLIPYEAVTGADGKPIFVTLTGIVMLTGSFARHLTSVPCSTRTAGRPHTPSEQCGMSTGHLEKLRFFEVPYPFFVKINKYYNKI